MLISGSEHLISFVYFSGHNLQNTEGLPVSSGRKEEEEEKKKTSPLWHNHFEVGCSVGIREVHGFLSLKAYSRVLCDTLSCKRMR